VIAAIEACTQTRCEAILGKPNPVMIETALHGLDVERSGCVLVGDRHSTDIRMGLDVKPTPGLRA